MLRGKHFFNKPFSNTVPARFCEAVPYSFIQLLSKFNRIVPFPEKPFQDLT